MVDLDVSPTEVTELARWQELGVRHNTELRAFRASDAGRSAASSAAMDRPSEKLARAAGDRFCGGLGSRLTLDRRAWHDPRGSARTAIVRCRYAVGVRVYVLGVGAGQVIFGLTLM